MVKKQEGVFTVYKESELVAIIKRDDISKKHIVYLCKEATGEDIAEMIAENAGFDIQNIIENKL